MLPALLLIAAAGAGCSDHPEALQRFEGDPVPVYAEVLRAVFDSVRLPPEHLVFPDRFVAVDDFTRSEAGVTSVIREIAEAYPPSRVCEYSSCNPTDGETMVVLSRISPRGPADVQVAVLVFHYRDGAEFGDGFRARLEHDGELWRVGVLDRFVVE